MTRYLFDLTSRGAPRDWSLDGRARNSGGEAPVHRCPHCGAINALAAHACIECGAILREPPRERELHIEIAEPLIEVDRLTTMTYREATRWAGSDERRLRAIAKARGYRQGWVWHRLREIAEGQP